MESVNKMTNRKRIDEILLRVSEKFNIQSKQYKNGYFIFEGGCLK